ncbi:MAG: hypothetical protein H6657_20815 [Ardenticatenaceae bacterium]|nr:hypothetical protein [Ardenticatenaceae bacterium]
MNLISPTVSERNLEEAPKSALKTGYIYMDYSARAFLARLDNRTGQWIQTAVHLQKLHRLTTRLENSAYISHALAWQAYLANA